MLVRNPMTWIAALLCVASVAFASTKNPDGSITYNLVGDAGSFDINGACQSITWGSGPALRLEQSWFASGPFDYQIEFVGNASQLQITGFLAGPFGIAVDGGPLTTVNGTAMTGTLTLAAGLAPGWHLFQFQFLSQSNGYINGFTLSGGTNLIRTQPKAKATLVTDAATNIPGPTPVRIWGAYAPSALALTSGKYSSFTEEFAFIGRGVDVVEISDNGAIDAVTVDGGMETLFPLSTPALPQGYAYLRATNALPYGPHTIRVRWIGEVYNTVHVHVAARVWTGAALTSAAPAGAISLALDTVSTLAVGDWLEIDRYENKDYVRVASINGTTVGLVSPTKYAHAAGTEALSWNDTPGTIGAWAPDAPGLIKLMTVGDSNTHGANYYGANDVPGPGGVVYLDPDDRLSYGNLMCEALGYEYINLGITGTDTNEQASRENDMVTYGRGGVDYILIMEGTNDTWFNGAGELSIAQITSNIQSQLTVAMTALNPGGKILLLPINTPLAFATSNNPVGYSVADVDNALIGLAGANPGVTYVANAWATVNLSIYDPVKNPKGELLDNLHYMPTGYQKLANNLMPYVSPNWRTIVANLATGRVVAGTAGTRLTVNGSGFVPASTIVWNGAALATTFISSNQLTASVSASMIAAPGSYPVSVSTPGSSASNCQFFVAMKTPEAAVGLR